MKLWSMSMSFRLGLGFHALNNEGADGSNLMQPRRIDVGDVTYDGISGEIVRRHILENFVSVCQQIDIPLMPMSEGLHPDRGPLGIRAAAKKLEHERLTSEHLYASVRRAIKDCAVLDVGGFLAAFGQDVPSDARYVAESAYLSNYCADMGEAEPVKRESCFDVGWLISEEPQDLTITQHSAFRDTASLNSRYAQSMRSNVYGGVIRADLHRIGMDDHWYLLNQERPVIDENDRQKRQRALVDAVVNFIASPTGAKTAAWAPHVFLTEGAILLTSARTAPFTSPIKVDLQSNASDGNGERRPVLANSNYREAMLAIKNGKDTWVWTFNDVKQLIEAGQEVIKLLTGASESDGKTENKS